MQAIKKEILRKHLASYIYICTLKVLLNMLICSPNKRKVCFSLVSWICKRRINLYLCFPPKIKDYLSFNNIHLWALNILMFYNIKMCATSFSVSPVKQMKFQGSELESLFVITEWNTFHIHFHARSKKGRLPWGHSLQIRTKTAASWFLFPNHLACKLH